MNLTAEKAAGQILIMSVKKNFTAIPDMPLHHHPSVRTGDELLPLIAAIRGKSQSGVKPLSPIPEWMKVCRNQDLKLNIRGTHVPICFAPPVYDPTSPVEYNSYFYLLLPLPFFFLSRLSPRIDSLIIASHNSFFLVRLNLTHVALILRVGCCASVGSTFLSPSLPAFGAHIFFSLSVLATSSFLLIKTPHKYKPPSPPQDY